MLQEKKKLCTTAANLTNPSHHHNKGHQTIKGEEGAGRERASEHVHRSKREGLQRQVLVPVAMVTPLGPSKGISWITYV